MTDDGFADVSRDDPLGCRSELVWALSRPDLAWIGQSTGDVDDTASADQQRHGRQAAYNVAVALGRCRLFGVDPVEVDGNLPEDIALAATQRATELLEIERSELETLDERWTAASSEFERNDLAASPLETLLENWAIQVALDELLEALGDSSDPALATLLEAIDRREESLALFQRQLHLASDLLCTVCELPLLENWRSFLSGPYRSSLPWWLDGTLEARAAEIAREVSDWLPGDAHWKRQASPGDVVRPELRQETSAPAFKGLAKSVLTASSPQTPSEDRTYRWISPDGQFKARLQVPGGFGRSDVLSLIHYGPLNTRTAFGVPVDSLSLNACKPLGFESAGMREVALFDRSVLEGSSSDATPELIIQGIRWLPER
jgi:hypothetical protein